VGRLSLRLGAHVLAPLLAGALVGAGCGSSKPRAAARATTTTTPTIVTTTTTRTAPRLLAFSRTTGYRHASIPAAIAAVGDLARGAGIGLDATEDPTRFSDAGLAPYDGVVFLLTTGDVLDDAQQAAFERFIRRGGGFAGVHSASDTEYGWPFYAALLGAQFKRHPAQQTAIVKVEDSTDQSTRAIPARWSWSDEWYDFRSNPRPGVHVLLSVDEATYQEGGMGTDHPVAWCHRVEGGRSWYTSLGHADAAYADPVFRSHLLGGLEAAAGLGRQCPATG
jgi:type 1 glutamine amidotransferase